MIVARGMSYFIYVKLTPQKEGCGTLVLMILYARRGKNIVKGKLLVQKFWRDSNAF
jgi:hypothetical protein